MFKKVLIANRGDKRRAAVLAAQAHVGAAEVTPKPDCRAREACRANEPRHYV